ncbi:MULTISPECIES: twin-arginine translocase subunit TatC [Marinomonas]|uniref:Sec-independent protein translocase protein TatC n=1 Tax=Marinomonas arctica TaxID=383750 RepID=A0A7H1J566_9GAMM|nr:MULTISPECIES: twin-arginine translocase subunit TatC [Marinomonas]MCS7486336.1 twin-arginine protein translocation system subunit TatC [Marinomonas sp. BSi20414]QNT05632.1 twin-arginine translocase subunit TatC [Marinomonas arctica]GGN29756.1 Sec-independent protein translocase protein TatC [Marinomonas arctica]
MSTDSSNQAPLVAHLLELRNRLLKSVLAILILFVGLYAFANDLYLIVSEPLRLLLPPGSSLIATEVASPFLAPLKLTFFVAVLLSVPYTLYQAWSFIAPALYKNEKQIAIPLLVSSIFLFYAGVLFAYYIVLPLIFGFFTTVGPGEVTVMTDINNYLNFVLKLFFAFGVTFEIPVATYLLIKAGVTTVAALSKKRPYIFLGCFVVGMLITPPDIFSQTLLAIPMWLLFELGLLAGRTVKVVVDGSEEQSESAQSTQ